MTKTDDAVFELQGYLRNIGRLDSDIERVVPDGIFGEETTLSVKSFQRKYGIKETGVVDLETWESLLVANRQAVFIASAPIQVVRITNEDLPLTVGTENEFVHVLKLMLNDVAAAFSNFSTVGTHSFFDEETLVEVEKWQDVIAVKKTGEVDKMTWNTLGEFYLLHR